MARGDDRALVDRERHERLAVVYGALDRSASASASVALTVSHRPERERRSSLVRYLEPGKKRVVADLRSREPSWVFVASIAFLLIVGLFFIR